MRLSRRRFIHGLGLTAVSLGGGVEVLAEDKRGAPLESGTALVFIQLAGGNDGLNTVVPLEDAPYRALRPSVGLKAEEVQALGSDQLYLHGSMSKVASRFTSGEVAIVQGVGYPKSSRSHFESSAVWQTGRLEGQGDGWLGRGGPARLPGSFARVGIGGGSLTPALFGSLSPATALASLEAFAAQPDRRFPGDAPALLSALGSVYARPRPPGVSGAEPIREVGESALQSSQILAAAATQYLSMVSYPRGPFGDQLKLAAQLLSGRLGVRVVHLTLGGFDTHANQKRQQANLLGQLSDGVNALLDDLSAHEVGRGVTVVTYSEFGRRVAENASNGTDHGAGSVMFLMGPRVKGGLYGNRVDLAHLDSGDVLASVDFRTVFAAALQAGLGIDPEPVLGKHKAIDLFRS